MKIGIFSMLFGVNLDMGMEKKRASNVCNKVWLEETCGFMKKIFIFLSPIILFWGITACSAENQKINLSPWLGTYVFEEDYDYRDGITTVLQYYEVTIYEDNGEYSANIFVDHW